MRKISQIILHCSASPEGSGQTAKGIKRFHVDVRGYSDSGYHFVIEDDGVLRTARPVEKVGAHARPNNRGSIGVCYTGGLGSDGHGIAGPNEAQQATLRTICTVLLHTFYGAELIGHRDMGAKKDCPCFDVAHWWRTCEMVVSRNLA